MTAAVIGVVSPRSNDSLPEGPSMYPDVKCIARGVDDRLRDFLAASGFDVLALQGFDIREFGAASKKTDEDIVALADKVRAEAPRAESLLISCGGLRTLEAGRRVEDKHGVPVVSSTESAYWAAVRMVGESGRYPGYGRLLESREPN